MTSHQRLPISSRDLDISTNVISADILCTIFKDAEVILNNPGSITDVPSRNKDCKAVRNEADTEPLIVKPTGKNKSLFECKCRVFVSLSVICHHTVAVSHVTGKFLEYCIEVKKKLTAPQDDKRAPTQFDSRHGSQPFSITMWNES